MLADLADQPPLPLPPALSAVRWTRHARARRISLRIDQSEGRVVVTLPPRAGRAAGMALLARHADWIAERLAALPRHTPIEPGAVLPLDGVPRVLRHEPAARGFVRIEPAAIVVGCEAAFLARRLTDHLRAMARSRFGARAVVLARAIGVSPRRVVIKDTRSRWGSCSADRVLMFSWRLILAPPRVQEYVVAHEVAHLRHLDHGAGFWRVVDGLNGDRAAASAWLTAQGPALLRIG